MKIKNLLAIALVAVLAPAAMADVTINITGSSAVRKSLHNSIKTSLTGVTYGFDGSDFTKSTYAIFKGTITGISGTVTVRTSFTGSVEGVRDLGQGNNVPFLPVTTTVSGGSGSANASTSSLDSVPAQIALSDVFLASTPFDNGTMSESGDPLGVIAFNFVANQGSTITNVTPQSMRALATNGSLPLGVFTGATADNTTSVLYTGRNDGSGTRVTVLAETGYGYTTAVHQWKSTATTGVDPTNLAITTLQLWPTNDGAFASTVYTNGADIAENGGYDSGGKVSALLGGTTTSVTLKFADGSTNLTGQNVQVIGYLGTSDTVGCVANGGVKLSYSGVSLNADSSSIINPEVVYAGQYTLWGYEHLFVLTGTDADTSDLGKFITKLKGEIPNNLSNVMLDYAKMKVSRDLDGHLVGP